MGMSTGRPGVRRRRPISRGPCKPSRQFQDALSPEETATFLSSSSSFFLILFFFCNRVIRVPLCLSRSRDDESTII